MLVERIERACRQASGNWTGCDWQTEFGTSLLNLKGLKACHALLLARATSGSERADWQAAVDWLAHIELDAGKAAAEGKRALMLARCSEFHEALVHAEQACAIEAKYHGKLVWLPFREAIEAAISEVR